MGKKVPITMISAAAFTITVDGMYDQAARQSDLVTNSNGYPAALISAKIKSGSSTPDDGSSCPIHLIRKPGNIADDNAGSSDADITIINTPYLDAVVFTDDADTTFYKGAMDTARLGPLGGTWGIAVGNETGQALADESPSAHSFEYSYYVPEQET